MQIRRRLVRMESLFNAARSSASTNYTSEDMSSDKIKISVIGVGGAGCNTINRLSKMGIKSAETIAVNTDQLHLKMVEASKRILIGKNITKGLGAGGFPEVAQKCAEASKDKLQEAIAGSELVFISAGMGGGTGTGAAPVIAEVARKEGAIVISMVTLPFSLERARIKKALWGLEQLKNVSDTIVVVDNNRLVSYVPNLPMNQAFAIADEIVSRAVKGISDTITFPSLINIDFADVKSIMGKAGIAVISVGEGKGNDRVKQVVRNTLDHPLLDADYRGAKGALIHINGGSNLALGEATQIGEQITSEFDDKANVIWGARLVPEMNETVTVTSIMTGIHYKLLEDKLSQQADAQKDDKLLLGVEGIQYL